MAKDTKNIRETKNSKTIKVEQFASPQRRNGDQRQTLVGLGLNKIGRSRDLPDTPATRGMVRKVQHLVRLVEK